MRLRQLARKLDVNPNRLLDILNENGHQIENDPNFKLTEAQEALINGLLAPKVKEEIKEVVLEVESPSKEAETPTPTPEKKIVPKKIELKTPKVKKVELEAPKIYSLEKEMEEKTKDIELIKAPKLKLDGLKVLGKIDLPAPKEKAPKVEQAPEAQKSASTKERAKNSPAERKRQPERKPRPNSIELERRRLEREAKQKREAEEKYLKAQKEKHYKETVLAKQKAQAAKKKKNSPVIPTVEAKVDKPKAQKVLPPKRKKSALGRFWAWLNGAYDKY